MKRLAQKIDSLLLLAGAVLAICAMVMLYNLNKEVNDSRATTNSSLLYFTIRTELELANVLNEVNGFILQETTLESLQQRYEILFGRFIMFERSTLPLYSENADSIRATFEQVQQILFSIEKPIGELRVGDVEAAKIIRESIKQMRPLMSDLSVQGSRQRLGIFQSVNDSLTDTIRAGTLLLLSTLLFAAFTVGRFWYSMRTKARFNEVLEREILARTNDLQLSNNELTKQISERQRTEKKLAQKDQQILQAQKLEAIGRLTAGIAHDFNNLLAVIMGNIELATLNGNREKSDEFLDNALSAGSLGSQLTRKLLAFGRRSTLSPEVINVNHIVSELDDLFVRTVFESHQVKYEFANDLKLVSVDRPLFENVVLNLVINARDASPVGGVITVRTSNVNIEQEHATKGVQHILPGEYVRIEVCDSGSGMTPDILEQAVEPFFSTKSEAEGSGLGLSMAYGFAQQSHGRICVKSEAGKGTRVELMFPVSYGKVVESVSDSSRPVVTGNQRAKKILVAEDDDAVRRMVLEQIQNLGFDTIGVSNGQDAYELICSDDSIDLLLTDVVMKGDLQGPQLAELALQSKPQLKIVLMSGYPEGVRKQSIDTGSVFVRLSKPISLDELSSTLNNEFETDKNSFAKDLVDDDGRISHTY